MCALRFSLTIGCLLVIVGIALGEILHVPGEYQTIQDAIYAAVNSDTVLVADGTYTGDGNRDIDFVGRAIVVMSENGPDNCIIDCDGSEENQHRGFYFHSGEDSTSVLQGFSIQNGYMRNWPQAWGGAVCCDSSSSPTITGNTITENEAWGAGGIFCNVESSPTITGNTISGNFAQNKGGGISCHDSSSPTITGNTISGNMTTFEGGGGIYCEASSPTITDNTITENEARVGGGIFCYVESSPTITGNTISENFAYDNGGGISCRDSSSPTITGNTIAGNITDWGGGISCLKSSPTIEGNMLVGNYANACGGGIYCSLSSATITGNTISGNIADWSGGGIFCCRVAATPIITGNTISRNTTYGSGGGIACENSSPIIIGTTITGNKATSEGGGINCYNSSPTITNCIIWGDSPDEIAVMSGDPVVTYSDIQGGWEGEGNIDENPMFVLPDKQDVRLFWESPCIDTGDPNLFDADGTRSDKGAHYFNQNDFLTLYLTPDATEMLPGDELGVTYTAINRRDTPELFWALSQVLLPGGSSLNVLGPDQYTLPANYTAQVHITHPVPNITPTGVYEYRSLIGMPPGTLYDDDSFGFTVNE